MKKIKAQISNECQMTNANKCMPTHSYTAYAGEDTQWEKDT
jgi:hypothetical protein